LLWRPAFPNTELSSLRQWMTSAEGRAHLNEQPTRKQTATPSLLRSQRDRGSVPGNLRPATPGDPVPPTFDSCRHRVRSAHSTSPTILAVEHAPSTQRVGRAEHKRRIASSSLFARLTCCTDPASFARRAVIRGIRGLTRCTERPIEAQGQPCRARSRRRATMRFNIVHVRKRRVSESRVRGRRSHAVCRRRVLAWWVGCRFVGRASHLAPAASIRCEEIGHCALLRLPNSTDPDFGNYACKSSCTMLRPCSLRDRHEPRRADREVPLRA